MLRTSPPPGILQEFRRLLDQWTLDDLHHLIDLLRPLFWAYALGSTLLAALVAALAYRAALAAGDSTPDTKAAAERGLAAPYRPPAARP